MSEYTNTLTSFSGADLVVSFGSRVIGELQQISWAVQRQKAPIYTLGGKDPRSFTRGTRGIAGSLVFVVFNRDALIEELKHTWEEIAPKAMFTAKGSLVKREMSDFEQALGMSDWNEATTGEGVNAPGVVEEVETPEGFANFGYDHVVYADMIPPFDVTMTYANEYGNTAFQKIYDVDILNEGSGISVDSLVMERQLTYIARRISPIMTGTYQSDSSGTI